MLFICLNNEYTFPIPKEGLYWKVISRFRWSCLEIDGHFMHGIGKPFFFLLGWITCPVVSLANVPIWQKRAICREHLQSEHLKNSDSDLFVCVLRRNKVGISYHVKNSGINSESDSDRLSFPNLHIFHRWLGLYAATS